MPSGPMDDPRSRLILAGAACLAVVAGASGARAEEPCAHLTAPPDLPPAWRDAVSDLALQLVAVQQPRCKPITLSIEAKSGAVRVVAQAGDGRLAVRNVADPSLLVATALGLVISIPDDETLPVPAPAPLSAAPAPPNADAPNAHPAVAVAAPSRPVSVWLGVALGARFGVPSAIRMADIELRADLLVDRLLLYASFQNAPIGFVSGEGSDGDAYRESSVAFGVGRRFPLSSCSLDVSIAPSLVTMRLGRDVPTPARASDVDLRVGASLRLNVPLSPAWQMTLNADTDVIPDGLRSAVRNDPLPPFPAWTAGLRVGVSGAVL
jgi:hypothetical protein